MDTLRYQNLLAGLLVAVIVIGLAGCESLRSMKATTGLSAADSTSPEELSGDLEQFDEFVEHLLIAASSEIASSTQDKRRRQNATKWRNTAIRQMRSHAFEDEPVDALLETWAYVMRMRMYLETPEATRYLGTGRTTALEAVQEAEDRIAEIAATHLPSEDLPRIRDFVMDYSRKNAMTGFLDDSAASAQPVSYKQLQAVTDLVMLPLSPLLTFQKVNQTADAVNEFNRIAERFADIMEDLPRDLRWESESLVETTLADDRVTSVIASLEGAAAAADRASDALADWPRQSGLAAREILTEFDRREPTIRELLAESRRTSEQLNAALETARATTREAKELPPEIAEAATALEGAARAVGDVIEGVERLRAKSKESDGDGANLDPVEIRDAADSLRAAAVEIRGLLDDLETADIAPVADDIEKRFNAAREDAAADTRAIVDHAFARGLQLLGLLFLGGLILIIVSWRLRSAGS